MLIDVGSLKYLADSGKLEKAARGIYTLMEVWEDEFVNLQSRYKKGMSCGLEKHRAALP